VFPLGDKQKSEVRQLAEDLGLDTANKPESMDICFIGGGSYAEFVEARLKADEIRKGSIVRESTGETLGEHGGIHRFTIGQRRGLGVSHPEPLYVKGVDAETGNILVGTKDEINERRFTLERCNWLRWETPPSSFSSGVQVRYRHHAVAATVEVGDEGRAVVTLEEAQAGIAPGQAAVFYDGDEVLGGGWIERVQ
jgi:tRNA-specific 2-thiouridylase